MNPRGTRGLWATLVAAAFACLAPTDPPPVASPAAPPAALRAALPYAAVTPGRTIEFPVDYGSHPEFRTEWWYVTGWLSTRGGETLGFQITFFRTKPAIDADNPSAFAPRQLLVAHCALSDP